MYKVRGYAFESLEQAQIAQKEVEKIRYIRSKTKMDDPDAVLQIYRKLILQEVFETPVGMEFLKELQGYLHTIPYIKYEDVLPIPVYAPEKSGESGSRSEKNNYRRKYHRSLFFAIVFAIVIGTMFAITYVSGDNVTILNYENELIDKYENWEQKLDTREKELDQREAELNVREQKLEQQEAE